MSQQRWFDASYSDKVVNAIISHQFLEYRKGIQDYKQECIEKFLVVIKATFSREFNNYIPDSFAISTCESCGDIALWINQEIIYPRKSTIDPPNKDLEEGIKSLYLEAANIFKDSPKGATALLRLALQMLLKQIGKEGRNINSDIRELVTDGLSPKIQQALDLLRVVGNNAVHPGQINLDDNQEVALKLFHILNFIADELITKPKELEALYNDVVPESTRNHIAQTDG
ncbi:MAG: DUF4145 domain-containing protein [Candidatus Thiodiazotropha sp. 'RUGA']|nr:DUF4145 domain-containing protein [Candidatus Thiodiazotropha sp. 'RUGA']